MHSKQGRNKSHVASLILVVSTGYLYDTHAKPGDTAPAEATPLADPGAVHDAAAA